jgi:hypothetical protein
MVGQTLGHYRIVREIGAGGMGVGYYYVGDASNLYFIWSEHDGDIWVADLVAEDNR